MTSNGPNHDLLLDQEGWLQGLARRLVSDAALADDAVQETFLMAMERPPRGATSPPILRAWLAIVLRGNVSHSRSSRRRRAVREETVAKPESDDASDAALIVSRAESSRMLVDEVMALREPHRSVLMLRYFEGLDSPGIAAELGISPEAVRSRLGRARRQLRERLDARYAGDREKWISALLPVAGWSAAPAAISTFATGGAFLTMKIALALTVSAAALFLTHRMLADEPLPVAGLPIPKNGVSATGMEAKSIPTDFAELARGLAGAQSPAEAEPRGHVALAEDGLFRPLLLGTVRDEAGQGVAGAEVVASWDRFEAESPVYARTNSDADGAYRLELPARALISKHSHLVSGNDRLFTSMYLNLRASAEGHGPMARSIEYPHGEPSVFEQAIVLAEVGAATGWSVKVVDARGEPVEKVQVGLFDTQSGRLLFEEGFYFWQATDSQGIVGFDRRPSAAVIPVAYTQDRWLGWGPAQAPVEVGPVLLTVEVGEQVSLGGQLLDSAGVPVAASSVRFAKAGEDGQRPDFSRLVRTPNLPALVRPWEGLATEAGMVETDHGGSFGIAGLQPGDYWFRLDDGSVQGPFPLGSRAELRLIDRYQLPVRVVDTEGRVVRGSFIHASKGSTSHGGNPPVPASGWQTLELSAGEWTLTAAHGDADPVERTVRVPEELGESIELVLDFEATTWPLTLVPLDPAGDLIPGALVEVTRTVGAGELSPELFTCRDQPLDLQLRPGTYLLTVKPPLDNPQFWLPVSKEWEQESHVDPQSLELNLDRGGRLDFRWVGSPSETSDPGQGLQVLLRNLETGRRLEVNREGGHLAASGALIESGAGLELGPGAAREQRGPVLPPGNYEVTLEGKGLRTQNQLVRIVIGEVSAVSLAVESAH